MVDQLIRTNTDPTVEANIENQMNKQKSEIEQIQAAYILDEMVVQMENLVEEELQETYGYQIVNVEANWINSAATDSKELERVDVQLIPSDDQENKVEKVYIQIGETDPPTSKIPKDEADIKLFLGERWDIEEDIIHIAWKEE
ncbi:stage III sporulation protein AF [Gracilibacillus boraciitolerans JCM 21714]|uniref:Stage III sporulation protein AF n=2 Tax=Gracilibacillus boraciitolerans TaxID=307521 RepID=W4VDF2_9BACI|nr:stage III sporulation protein AF [Gracilibacillus boraciitolerans JCM 21714]